MMIVGERINSSRQGIAQAIANRDGDFICREAVIQAEAGADYIEVNAGVFGEKEVEYLEWLVLTVQHAVDKPLSIDSPSLEAVAAALRWHRGKALVNSITAERRRCEALLPLIKSSGCKVVALCMDDSGMPATGEGKISIACRLIGDLTAGGVALDDIYIDPLVHPISVDSSHGMVVLDVIEQVKKRYAGVHTICGVSNISFGLPGRRWLNQAFLVLAMGGGLDAAIVDPCDRRLMSAITAVEALLGRDEFCARFLKAYRGGKLDACCSGRLAVG